MTCVEWRVSGLSGMSTLLTRERSQVSFGREPDLYLSIVKSNVGS